MWRGFHLADDHRPLYTGYAIIEDEFAPEISANGLTKDGYTVMTYNLPKGGRVTHMVANLSAWRHRLAPSGVPNSWYSVPAVLDDCD
jgi:hypothetical protein